MASPTDTTLSSTDYGRADSFLAWHAHKSVFRAGVQPNWVKNADGSLGDRFWYRNRTAEGSEYILVDPSRGTREPAFDHTRLAAGLSLASGTAYSGTNLPFRAIDFVDAGEAVAFEVSGRHWQCDLTSYTCHDCGKVERPSATERLSPDGRWALFTRDYNLCVRSVVTGEVKTLTDDGEANHDYASSPDTNITVIANRVRGIQFPPAAVWSPDSRYVLTHRLDQRQVKELHLIQAVANDGSARPVLHTYRYPMPGDEYVAITALLILDLETGRRIEVQHAPLMVKFFSPIELSEVWWSRDGQRVYFLEYDRHYSRMRLCEVNPDTGVTRILVEETGHTPVEPNLFLANRPNIRILDQSQEIIWFSERDGWGHLYLYDAPTGRLKRQITSGAWVVRDIVYLDEVGRWVYFTGAGREPGCDPYYQRLYRVGLDGGEVQSLSDEDADHRIIFTPSGQYCIDIYGRVDAAPVTVLRAAEGRVVCPLEVGDFSRHEARGWRWPEAFTVKAADGMTDLYGALHFPTHFDPTRRYPIIDAIYGGPQTIQTIKSYTQVPEGIQNFWGRQALAELGFIVFTLDARGTAFRSKAFHNFSAGGRGDAKGLVDHAHAIRQLAQTRPYLDPERVGVYGFSAGGFAAARCVFEYPDTFHVAVSGCGAHDMACYLTAIGDRQYEILDGPDYVGHANATHAANLKGKLLLIHGELDDNVHPAVTMKVVNALIDANKDFDFLVLPNRSHSISLDRYCIRKTWDYFVQHLLGQTPPRGYRLQDPDPEFAPQLGMTPPSQGPRRSIGALGNENK